MTEQLGKPEKLGALWGRTTKTGKAVYSGSVTIDGKITRLTMWPNDRTGEAPDRPRPDFNLYLDTYVKPPRPESDTPSSGDYRNMAAPDDNVPF